MMSKLLWRGLTVLVAGIALLVCRQAVACNVYNTSSGSPAQPVAFNNLILPSIQYPATGTWQVVTQTVQSDVAITFAGPDCALYVNQLTMTKPTSSNTVSFNNANATVYKFNSDSSTAPNQSLGYILQYKTTGGAYKDIPPTMPVPLKFDGQNTITVSFRWALVVRPQSTDQVLVGPGGYTTTAAQVGNFGVTLATTPVSTYPFSFRVSNVQVQTPTCTFDPTLLNQDVDLGTYPLADFTGNYETPPRPVKLGVSGCNALVANNGLSIRFDPAGGAVTDPDYFPTNLPQLGLKLVALDHVPPGGGGGSDVVVKPGDTLNFQVQQEALNTYVFHASLKQLGALGNSATVSSDVELTINYL